MSIVIGLNCKLLLGTAGVTATGEVTSIADVSLEMDCSTAKVTTRSSCAWEQVIPTIKRAAIHFEMLYLPDDTYFEMLRDAYLNGSLLALFITNGDGTGLDCDAIVTEFRIEQDLEKPVKVEVGMVPSRGAGGNGRNPVWYVPSPDPDSQST